MSTQHTTQAKISDLREEVMGLYQRIASAELAIAIAQQWLKGYGDYTMPENQQHAVKRALDSLNSYKLEE